MSEPSPQAKKAFITKRVRQEGEHQIWLGPTTGKGRYPQMQMQMLHKVYVYQVRRVVWDLAHPEDPIRKNERIKHRCEFATCVAERCLYKEPTVKAVANRRKHGNEHFHVLSKEQHLKLVQASHVSFRAKKFQRENPEEALKQGLITAEEAAKYRARIIEKKQLRIARYEAIKASGKWVGRGKGIPKNRRKKVESSNAGSGNDGYETV